MEKTQKLGVKQSISSFVIPTGYTFNLDGSAIYQALAAIFLAQAYHIELSLGQQLTLLVVLMISSKGMAGVPGTSFVVLLTAIATIGVPPAGLALIAGVDRLIDMGRTAVNVIGNLTAVLVIAQSEKAFDASQHSKYLNELGTCTYEVKLQKYTCFFKFQILSSNRLVQHNNYIVLGIL